MSPPASPSPILPLLQSLHHRFATVADGNLANYIPELARANPEWFGICIVTATGGVYEVGDSAQPFTIQSISKPLIYGLALEDRGRTEVLEKIGIEPTGRCAGARRPRRDHGDASVDQDPALGKPLPRSQPKTPEGQLRTRHLRRMNPSSAPDGSDRLYE